MLATKRRRDSGEQIVEQSRPTACQDREEFERPYIIARRPALQRRGRRSVTARQLTFLQREGCLKSTRFRQRVRTNAAGDRVYSGWTSPEDFISGSAGRSP